LSNGRLSDPGRAEKPDDASAAKEVEEPGKELILDCRSRPRVALRRRETGSGVKSCLWCAIVRKAVEDWKSALVV
jgi:hypothetical protein